MTSKRPAHLEEGIRLFRRGKFFLAHETLEEHWVEVEEAERDFYQSLIHLSVAFLHFGRGNRKGARLQLQKARARLEAYPDQHHGIDVAGLRAFLADAPDRVERGEEVGPPELEP
ncbi:MAG: DUF309 domain-containing protein [Actinomycetota bacterium]